jgi:hypothetical protein
MFLFPDGVVCADLLDVQSPSRGSPHTADKIGIPTKQIGGVTGKLETISATPPFRTAILLDKPRCCATKESCAKWTMAQSERF